MKTITLAIDSLTKLVSIKQDFFDQILGGMSVGTLLAAFFFALIGITMMTAMNVMKGIKKNQSSPEHFSFKFFIEDTLPRLISSVLVTLIVIFLSVRFSVDLIGAQLTMIYSLGIGLSIDKATQKILSIASKATS
jgi:hypothetical protein